MDFGKVVCVEVKFYGAESCVVLHTPSTRPADWPHRLSRAPALCGSKIHRGRAGDPRGENGARRRSRRGRPSSPSRKRRSPRRRPSGRPSRPRFRRGSSRLWQGGKSVYEEPVPVSEAALRRAHAAKLDWLLRHLIARVALKRNGVLLGERAGPQAPQQSAGGTRARRGLCLCGARSRRRGAGARRRWGRDGGLFCLES